MFTGVCSREGREDVLMSAAIPVVSPPETGAGTHVSQGE